jgi:1-deoxy-D-xylulose-5-phosphate reductoisomerase
MAGPLIARKAKGLGLRLMPIDSEQSAIWQCLDGKDRGQVRTVYLTASGGPFWQKDQKSLARISVKDALAHPRWKMGRKITIDSATFMNKGLEVLEAMYLFDLAPEKISIVIHPESVVHSMVEFVDGTIMAQVSATDMRIPIQYALSYPARLSAPWPKLDLVKLKALNFAQPDDKKFPCLRLAYEAAAAGGTAPCVLNAANEVAVEAFVNKKIGFTAIPKVIEKVLRQHTVSPAPQLMEIVEADQWARRMAQTAVDNLKRKT